MATRQQFIFNDKTVNITTILFKNLTPLLNVEKIVFFKETGLTGNWLKKEFRYSFDNLSWSNWATLTQGSLKQIDFTNHPNFYLELLYTRANYNTASITDFYLFYDADGGTPVDPSTALIDADTLQGEPGSFYLDPANFVGPYPGIQVYNVADGSTAGVYSHRVDNSLGTEFYFKRIKGVGIQVEDSSGGIITLTSDASGGGAYYENPDPVSETVGGIIDGDSFFVGGKSFAETMQAIFYPLSYPNLTNPYNTFSFDADTLHIIGDTLSIDFEAGFNQGSINPQYTATSNKRSGIGNTVYYTGPLLPSSVGSDPPSPNSQNISYVAVQGYNTWTSAWAFNIGVQPYDSEGNIYNSPYPAGTTSYITRRFEGVYPIYATWELLSTPTDLDDLYSMINGNNIEIDLVAYPPFQPDPQIFEIPNVWLTARPLQGVETWNPLTLSWEYEGGTAQLSVDNFWVQTSTTHIINGIVNYTRFSYTGPESDPRGAAIIRLKF